MGRRGNLPIGSDDRTDDGPGYFFFFGSAAGAAATLPLSGAIRADNIEALFELLAADHGIRTQPRGAAEIALIPARRGP